MKIERLINQRRIFCESYKVFESYFINLGGSSIDAGGAMRKETDTDLSIIGSFFFRCNASMMGGSMILKNGSLEYHNNCAEECRILTKVDNKYGNHIYATNQNNVTMISTSAFRCAPFYESGDSTIGIHANNLQVISMNHSHCSSYG